MSIVQISKIQVRRGKKNSSSGVPQLSSAEFAWAVDTQELFIGNGSVQEGAPYVGNTKIITEHDNILELASAYRFANDDNAITGSVSRSLQSKVDEIQVSVRDFGAIGDGSTDNVEFFQLALTQLFRNADTNYRKTLMIPNGEYLFTGDLVIPSNVILQGESRNGVVLKIGSNSIRLMTENGTEVGFNSSNRPENIQIKNLTISRTNGQVVLTGLKTALFENVRFKGIYLLGNTVSSLSLEPSLVYWSNTLEGVTVTDIKFKDCTFEDASIGIKCTQTVVAETMVDIENCYFITNDTSIYIEGVEGQENKWRLLDSQFEEVANQVFRSTQGRGTIIDRCRFRNCGNNTNSAAFPVSPMVYFGDKTNNVLINCSSNRQQEAGFATTETVSAITEVYNSDKSNFVDRNYTQIYLSDSFRPFAVLSSDNRYMVINYFLKLSSYSRMGQLVLTVDDDYSHVSISDHYQYSPSLVTSSGGTLMTNFEFDAQLKDADSDSSLETIVLYYKNPNASGAEGTISFDITYGV